MNKKVLGCLSFIAFVCFFVFTVASFMLFVLQESILWFLASMVSAIITTILFRTNILESIIIPEIRGFLLGFCFSGTKKRLSIGKSVKFMRGHKNISFGDNVSILHHALFSPLIEFKGEQFPSEITIGNNVSIGAYTRIASKNKVIIQDDVLFSAFVHITDHSHDYREAGVPIMNQGLTSKGPVVVGKGSWLAYGAQIVGGGINIGNYSVVAANAVVTKDVPPYSIVAGVPAKVIMQYDFNEGKWKNVM